jgi:superfamily II DNA helicase RecQ
LSAVVSRDTAAFFVGEGRLEEILRLRLRMTIKGRVEMTKEQEAAEKAAKETTKTVEAEVEAETAETEGTEKVASKTETKEDEAFDQVRAMETIRNLREIEKQAKRDKAELERLKKLEEERKLADLSETDRLKAQIVKLEKTIEELTTRQMQIEAAEKVKLPMIFADRIRGETPEEMEADAKALLEAMPKGKGTPDTGETNPGENKITGETDAQRRKRLIG